MSGVLGHCKYTAKRRGRLFCYTATALVSACLWNVGCGDIETTEEVEPPSLDSRVGDGFVTENLGIGEGWYAYDSTTHVITPHDVTDVVRVDDVTTGFVIDSYYDDEGTSGHISVTYRQDRGDGFGEVQSASLGNIKESPVCWNLNDVPAVAECSSEWTLRLAAAPRIVPAAGFAVGTPMITTSGSFDALSGVEVSRLSGGLGQLDGEWQASADEACSALATADGNVLSGRNEAGRTFYQATPSGHVVRWTIESTSGTEVEIAHACAPMVMSSDVPLEFGPIGTAGLSTSNEEAVGVQWCEGDALVEGEYWDNSADLWLTGDGRLIVGVGSLIYDATDNMGEVHSSLWAAEP